jgi:hypothetical protein
MEMKKKRKNSGRKLAGISPDFAEFLIKSRHEILNENQLKSPD